MFKRFMRVLEEAGEGGEGGAGGTDPQLEQQARNLGWVPQDEWEGPPEKWKPAAEFVARGEEIMPILKANNRRLSQQLSAQSSEMQALKQQIAEQNEVLRALKETNDEIAKERKEGQVRELTEQIAAARENNDVAMESRLQARLTNLTRELEEDDEEEEETRRQPTRRQQQQPPPDFRQQQWWQDWSAENAWYGQDKDLTDLADALSMRMRQDPANNGLREKAFMDKLTSEVLRLTGRKMPASGARSRVEGGGNRGGSGGGESGYEDLPAEAKAQCARQAKRLVGDKPGQFKTEKEYRAYYAKIYFSGAKA